MDSLPKSIRRGNQKPAKGYERITETPERVFVPYASINLLAQTRQAYHQHFLEELARGMIEYDPDTQKGKVNNLQPPRVALFSREQAVQYLEDLNMTWDTNHTIEDLKPIEDDCYIILIYGHQRILAEDIAFGWLEKDSERQEVPVHLEYGDNLDFRRAIKMQYRENFHSRPESWEDAQAIFSIYKSGGYETFADCARELAVSEERVARAHRYQTLPDEVRRLVEESALSYSKALRLTDLFAVLAYDTFRHDLVGEQKEAIAQKIRQNKYYLTEALEHVPEGRRDDLEIGFMLHAVKAISELKTEKDVAKYVENTCRSILHADQLMLIALDESQQRQEELRLQRQEVRTIAIASLRSIIGILANDERRIEGEQPPLLTTSPTMVRLLKVVFSRLSDIDTLLVQLNKDDAIRTGETILAELEKGLANDVVDEVSRAMAA